MNEFVFPSSPNWFLSSVSSGNDAGLYAFGARNFVYVYDVSSVKNNSQQQPQSSSQVVERNRELGRADLLHGLPRLVSCYTQHELKVSSVCLSPDSDQQICCSADEKDVLLWDILSLTTIKSHSEHKDKVTCMAWSSCDLDVVLTASERGTVVLWRLKSNTVTSFQPLKDYVYCVKASPHSPALVALGYRSGVVLVVNIASDAPRVVQKLRGIEAEITSVCWCPIQGENWLKIAGSGDSRELLAAGGGRLIKVWNAISGEEVFYKKLQHNAAGSRFNSQDPMGKKLWIELKWSRLNPDYLISSSCGPQGDLCLWNLQTLTQYEPELFDSSNINKHSRIIFNMALAGDKICSFSLDRMIAVWDLTCRRGLASWCSIGGYVCAIRASPVDPGVVAISAGDNVIRVWNQNNKSKHVDVTNISYGVRCMITSVAWHPEREGLLAYGTDNGKVGIINTLTVKPPVMSKTMHARTVYVVCWGPPLRGNTDSHRHYQVYSVGDGVIFQHFFDEHGSKKSALNLLDTIREVSGVEGENQIHSELAWKKDFTAFAVGLDNGSVHVYSFPSLKRIYSITVHQKMVNCVRWHPDTTAESVHSSPCRNWVAFAGNAPYISVVDLPHLFVGAESDTVSSAASVTEALCQLDGHRTKTTDICWSPHHDGRLVSVGYDRTAIVWNVKTGEGLASFCGHIDRILTVMWSYLDPDLILSAGCDSTLRVWRVSAQSRSGIEAKDRKKKRKFFKMAAPVATRASEESDQGLVTASEQEIQELQDLLVAKQQQLMAQMQCNLEVTDKAVVDDTARDGTEDGTNNVSTGLQTASRDQRYQPPYRRTQAVPTPTNSCRADSPDTPSSSSFSDSVVTTNAVAAAAADVSSARTVPAITENSPALLRRSRPALATGILPADAAVASGTSGKSGGEGDDSDAEDQKVVPTVKNFGIPVKSSVSNKSEADSAPASSAADLTEKSRKRKIKAKSLFPVTSAAINRCKAALHEDVLDLSRIVAGQGSGEIVDSKPHLGLFTNRLGAHRCLLQESEHHLSHGNMEYHLQLELWRGNVAGAVQIARQRNELSDWIVSMAPLASHDLWEAVSSEYAEQLEEDGQYHKAVTYLLAANKVHQAVDLFRRHKLFKEAVLLARIRLSPVDPILEDLYSEWGQTLMKDGQYELAAKCYLAMRHIQEAEKALVRRHCQSSLKTACHMTLLVSDKQQSLVYAYKLFSQYLMMGQWQEALKFSLENESFKILQPILLTHELLIEHLTALCPSVNLTQKQVTPEMYSHWSKKDAGSSNTQLPEYLLDKSEMDSVIPWELYLIGKHTFPHHLLQVWLQRLDITMVTQELKAMHAAISQMVPNRQLMVELPALFVQISVDVTLCLLALLTSETSNAIIHLLQAMSTLHQASHVTAQQALCRLILPQGPKYLLKLQQEFNASRVLLTMDRHGDLGKAGGDQPNSIRKYLTDIKDDHSISTPGVRCRELDSLRAYYYLAVLGYLRDNMPGSHSDNDSLDGMPNGKLAAAPQKMTHGDGDQKHVTHLVHGEATQLESFGQAEAQKMDSDENVKDLDQNGKLSDSESRLAQGQHLMGSGVSGLGKSSPSSGKDCDKRQASQSCPTKSLVMDSCVQKPLSSSQELLSFPLTSSIPGISGTESSDLSLGSSSVDPPSVPSSQPFLAQPAAKDSNSTGTLPPVNSPFLSVKHAAESSGSPAKDTSDASKDNVVRGDMNYPTLLKLSKAILWDVQAKREALTETLGYVHQAISQHLLFNRSSSDHAGESDTKDSSSITNNNSSSSGSSILQTASSDHAEDGGCSRTRLMSNSATPESDTASDGFRRHTASGNSTQTLSCSLGSSIASQAALFADEAPERGLVRSLSDNFPTYQKVEQELLGPSECQSEDLQKPRKIFWEDSRDNRTDTPAANGSSTFQISKLAPDGSPIPLEWDELPVDIKYSMPYVSLSLLKQEQEVLAQELRKVPDASKVPFPPTWGSVKQLLHASLKSPRLSASERSGYYRQLKDWASVFAVTTFQQKDLEALFAATAAEHFIQG